jgi:hypothetical protein
MIKIIQFGRRTQSVPIGTESMIDKANASDPPYRCTIGGRRSTPHTPTTLMMVGDLRSGHRSIEITFSNAYPKAQERQKRRSSSPISKDHTNSGADPKDLVYCIFRKLKHNSIWAFNLFSAHLN